MKDLFGSVRRSLVFRTGSDKDGGFGDFVEKMGSSIRNSRIGLFSKPGVRELPSIAKKDDALPIRWRKGELIGCGAFGRVYMGMNLDSGELLAVKQVSIAANSASKEKTQAHIRELEEEVKLLKNLSHSNIVRYLGTAREDESLNILLEFVPGGSISSLLGKFGSFPEPVIRMYTKQLLLGLEYLHSNGIMHRDIKGANILVDNKGCIKLADFGASKKVVELATINGAKSMKGTPYWMAPEVILQTGHSFSADIWSVGCTVIEMATGKPPWSQQYQEVAALFHIGTTKSHPPIPEHLSVEAKDFLLKCLQQEPYSRPSASELLQHPFVTGEYKESHPVLCASVMGNSGDAATVPGVNFKKLTNSVTRMTNTGSVRCSTMCPQESENWGMGNSDDISVMDGTDHFHVGASVKLNAAHPSDDFNKSFNPMCEPTDDWSCKMDVIPEMENYGRGVACSQTFDTSAGCPGKSGQENDFTFPGGPLGAEDDDEVTELKIRAFLDEKALELKKLQTPLYEEFYNTLNAAGPACTAEAQKENVQNILILPPKSRSPSRRLSAAVDSSSTPSPVGHMRRASNLGGVGDHPPLQKIFSPQRREWKEHLGSQQETICISASTEMQRQWKEELVEELERKRERLRRAGVGGKTPSPKDKIVNRRRDRSTFAFLGR